jgi:hypothetical protein
MEAGTQNQYPPCHPGVKSYPLVQHEEEYAVLGLANATHVDASWVEAEPLNLPELDFEFRSLVTNPDGTLFGPQRENRPSKRGSLSSLL